jgi:hypothetical protein
MAEADQAEGLSASSQPTRVDLLTCSNTNGNAVYVAVIANPEKVHRHPTKSPMPAANLAVTRDLTASRLTGR